MDRAFGYPVVKYCLEDWRASTISILPDLQINHNVPKVLLTDLRISNKSVIAESDAPIREHISVAQRDQA
jgi:hypothetical protein